MSVLPAPSGAGNFVLTKVAIVVGSAPCLHEDLQRALELYPFAFICTVNGACVEVEEADAIISGHTNKAEIFTEARRKAFPNGKPFDVFANGAREGNQFKFDYPSVTRWFGRDCSTGATSAAKAARMMFEIGFEQVILCGCPLDSSGYFSGESEKGRSISHDCRRLGDPEQTQSRAVEGYRRKFKKLADGEFKGRVFSMSGLTREWLGEPE